MKSLLVLCVVNTLVVLALSGTAEQKSKNCNEVRAAYSSKGFNVNDVPNKGVNGEFYKTSTFGNFECCNVVFLTLSFQSGGRGLPWFLGRNPGGLVANEIFLKS